MGKIKYLIVIIFASIAFTGIVATDSYAADARSFNAGRIIDDVIFTNSDSMTVQDIQNFLNSKVSCDTWGSKRSELGGGTRAQWMNARGIYAPFRCTTDYRENPATGQNNYGKNEAPAGSISAAEIIYNYSRQFRINPQVILATLQKENGMITDEWPTPKQFSEAMGFGCPDNVAPGAPACNPQYGSFSAQVYQAARHFRGYIDNGPGWWIPFNTGWNSIAWSPNASCGRGNVYIENRATVALYSYTPYQPNQAAKNAQYGTGDGCSAYGNRNFYLYFTDWFGSTYTSVNLVSDLALSQDKFGQMFNDERTASFILRNNSSKRMDIGMVGVASLSPSGRTDGFAMKRVVVEPHDTFTYSDTQTHFKEEGIYKFWIVGLGSGCEYCRDMPASASNLIVREWNVYIQRQPSIDTSLSVHEVRPAESGPITVSYDVRNNSNRQVKLGSMGATLYAEDGSNVGLPMVRDVVIAPNATRKIQVSGSVNRVGKYSTSILQTSDNEFWNSTYPVSSSAAIQRQRTFTVKPSVTIDAKPVISSDPRTGQPVSASFTARNYTDKLVQDGQLGLVVIDPDGKNVGYAMQDFSIQPNGQFIYSVPTRTFTKPGTYTAWITQFKNNYWSEYNAFEDGTATSKFTFVVR